MGASEQWLDVNKEGKVILHGENDGARFLRRGAEAWEEEVTLAFVKQHYPKQYQELAAEVAAKNQKGQEMLKSEMFEAMAFKLADANLLEGLPVIEAADLYREIRGGVELSGKETKRIIFKAKRIRADREARTGNGRADSKSSKETKMANKKAKKQPDLKVVGGKVEAAAPDPKPAEINPFNLEELVVQRLIRLARTW